MTPDIVVGVVLIGLLLLWQIATGARVSAANNRIDDLSENVNISLDSFDERFRCFRQTYRGDIEELHSTVEEIEKAQKQKPKRDECGRFVKDKDNGETTGG